MGAMAIRSDSMQIKEADQKGFMNDWLTKVRGVKDGLRILYLGKN